MTTPTTPPSASASSQLGSWSIDHAAIRVPEVDTAIAWYTERLDFRLKRSVPVAGLIFALLSPAADDGLSIELLAGPGAGNRPTSKDLHNSYQLSGWHHIGFRVDSVDHAVDELKRRGVTIVAEPRDMVAMRLRVAFIADPWSNMVEVIQSLSD